MHPNPDRASQFNCFASELSDGGCRAVLVTFDPAEGIPIGNGPLLSIDYAIKGSAPAGECKNLTPGAIKVSGENNQSLDAVSVPGTFCFLSCLVDGECNDENGCTDDTCDAGQCTYQCNAPSSSDLCCRLIQAVSQIHCVVTLRILITMAFPTVKTIALITGMIIKQTATMTHTVMRATIAL